MLDEMFQQNASKFAIILEYENPRRLYEMKKTTWVFIFQKYGKF